MLGDTRVHPDDKYSWESGQILELVDGLMIRKLKEYGPFLVQMNSKSQRMPTVGDKELVGQYTKEHTVQLT
jgi:hypothetical protein